MLNEELCKCKICQCQRKQVPLPGSLGGSAHLEFTKLLLGNGDEKNIPVMDELCKNCFHGEHFKNEEHFSNEDPLKTLRIRLSKGEISLKEFDEIKKRI